MNGVLEEDMAYMAYALGDVERFKNKTILITGCGGFLGMNFSMFFGWLMDNELDIKGLILLDNFILGRPEWLEKLVDVNPAITVNPFDIGKDDLSSIDGASDVDYIIHLASIASPVYYRKYPIETLDANVMGLRNLLDYYLDKEIEGFLFFSSSEVYGDPDPQWIPTPESYRGNVATMGPRACYDEAKRFGETLCYYYAKVHKVPIRIARPFNNFGPGMVITDKRVPADFAKCVLNDKDIIILSDGKPTRTFCYVADAIVGYLKIMLYHEFDYFNIGMEEPEISVLELAQIYVRVAHELWGYEGNVIYKTSEEDDYLVDNPSRRCPDISKAKMHLAFEPKITVEEGIERYLRYLSECRLSTAKEAVL